MKVRLLGLGAVGAPIAVRLAGVCDFAILLSPDRVARYWKDGCTVNGHRYDFPVTDQDEDDVDLIIVACKNNDLAAALDEIAPHVGADTTIMSLLNGIESENVLASRFGQDRLVWSYITNLSSVRDGRTIDCFSPKGGLIRFNEREGVRTARIDTIAHLFDEAGIWYEVSDDIIHDMWWKFAFNIAVNSLSAVMGLDYARMNRGGAFHRLLRMVWREVRQVAAAEGVVLGERDEEMCLRVLSNMDGPGRTSMLQDVDAGRVTENRFFAGSIGAIARRHGIATPLCDFLYTQVETVEEAHRE